jgi:hydrogenase/urease accessory protein HupE
LVFLGGLVAANRKLPPFAFAALAGLYGALQGLLGGAALAAVGGGSSALLGMVATALAVALLTSAMVVPLRAAWALIAVRVAGSWVAAVGMLMLGWLFRRTG